jgi:hypothetical protein
MTAALLDAQPELDEVWHRKKLLGRLATPDELRGELFELTCAVRWKRRLTWQDRSPIS